MAINIKEVLADKQKRIKDCRNAMSYLIRRLIQLYNFTLPQFDRMLNNYVNQVMDDQGIHSPIMRSQIRANFTKVITSSTTTDKNLDKFIRMLTLSPELGIEKVEISIKITDKNGEEKIVSTNLYENNEQQ